MQEIRIWSLGRENPLEKEMPTHSNIFAWKIPWTEEPGGLQSTGRRACTWLSDFHSLGPTRSDLCPPLYTSCGTTLLLINVLWTSFHWTLPFFHWAMLPPSFLWRAFICHFLCPIPQHFTTKILPLLPSSPTLPSYTNSSFSSQFNHHFQRSHLNSQILLYPLLLIFNWNILDIYSILCFSFKILNTDYLINESKDLSVFLSS